MLAAERHHRILTLLHQEKTVRVAELARALDVSEMTIRRDLEALDRDELIVKVHGGATLPLSRMSDEPGFDTKLELQRLEKEAIARAALHHIQPGTAIGLTAGTTTWALAHLLREIPELTVVTNSPSIAELLAKPKNSVDHSVILTGGVRTPSNALVGPFAVRALRDVNLDQVFLGVHGMHSKTGLTTPNLLEAETNRAFVDAAIHTIVLADHTKWGTPGLARIAELTEIHRLITDENIDSAAHQALASALTDSGELEIALVNGDR